MTKGCRIWLIIGIILLVLALALVIVLVIFGPKIGVSLVGKVLDSSEAKILAKLPEGIDSVKVKEIYSAAHGALETGALKDPDRSSMVQGLVLKMQELSSKEELTKAEVVSLLHDLSCFAGMPRANDSEFMEQSEEMMPEDSVMVDTLAPANP